MSEIAAIDANVIVGLLDKRDVWHSRARTLVAAAERRRMSFVYFDFIAGEVVSVLIRRCRERQRQPDVHGVIEAFMAVSRHNEITFRAHRTEALYNDILADILRFRGTLNFNDVLLARVMREDGLQKLASFDTQFDKIPWIERIDA